MFDVTIKITDEQIAGLLCNAFEGGSNYWIGEVEQGKEPTSKLEGDDYFHWAQWWPVCGGSVLVTECDPDTGETKAHALDRAAIERGLVSMSIKSPTYFGDFISQNDDAETGDVFLQYCLFGEIVYG